jgi:hypothetical protein
VTEGRIGLVLQKRQGNETTEPMSAEGLPTSQNHKLAVVWGKRVATGKAAGVMSRQLQFQLSLRD